MRIYKSQSEKKTGHRTKLLAVLVVSTALSSAVAAQQAQQVESTIKAPQTAIDNSGARPGSIKVHGHWAVVIRNPDGSVTSRHEFNNSLRDVSVLNLLFNKDTVIGTNSYAIV